MPHTHFHLQRLSRARNRSAAREARYILCDKEFVMHRDERVYIEHVNLPSWTDGRALTFWEAVDMHERQRARLATMLTVALPRTLTLEEQKALIRDYLQYVFEETKVITWGIHAPQASDGQPQPHAHVLYSLRTIDGIDRESEHFFKQYNSKDPERGGTQKDLWFETDDAMYQMRKVWDAYVSQELARVEMSSTEFSAVPDQTYEVMRDRPQAPAYYLRRMFIDEDAGQSLQYREQSYE